MTSVVLGLFRKAGRGDKYAFVRALAFKASDELLYPRQDGPLNGFPALAQP